MSQTNYILEFGDDSQACTQRKSHSSAKFITMACAEELSGRSHACCNARPTSSSRSLNMAYVYFRLQYEKTLPRNYYTESSTFKLVFLKPLTGHTLPYLI